MIAGQEVRSTPRAGAREDLKRNWRSAHLAVFREVQESGVQEEKTCWYRRTMNAWAESTVKAQNSLRSGKCGARTICRSSILQLLTPATSLKTARSAECEFLLKSSRALARGVLLTSSLAIVLDCVAKQ